MRPGMLYRTCHNDLSSETARWQLILRNQLGNIPNTCFFFRVRRITYRSGVREVGFMSSDLVLTELEIAEDWSPTKQRGSCWRESIESAFFCFGGWSNGLLYTADSQAGWHGLIWLRSCEVSQRTNPAYLTRTVLGFLALALCTA